MTPTRRKNNFFLASAYLKLPQKITGKSLAFITHTEWQIFKIIGQLIMRIEDIKKLLQLLQLLTLPEEKALNSTEIGRKLFNKTSALDANELRTVQRYLKALSESSAGEAPLIQSVGEGRWRRYYHRPGTLAKWLMSEQTAHHLVLAQAVLQNSFGKIQELAVQQDLAQAEQVISFKEKSRRLRQKLRVVPDGLGRLPAYIDNKVLEDVATAIVNDRQLRYEYNSSEGKKITRTVSIQGLIAKDGAIYLIGTEGLTDSPSRAHPLQRFKETCVMASASQYRPDFNLDEYIEKTHQLSHSIEGKNDLFDLILRVNPAAIFHFQERPLGKSQKINQPTENDAWYLLSTQVPYTVLLVPFLLSMGPWIEIISPEKIKSEFISRLRVMQEIYKKDLLPIN